MYTQAVIDELLAAEASGKMCSMALSPLATFQMIAALQLACRHPAFRGTAREAAEKIARACQQQFFSPAVQAAIELGWDPTHDTVVVKG